MANFILGPSGVGKTNYINKKLKISDKDIIYAHQLKINLFKKIRFWKSNITINKNSTIHYNLLYPSFNVDHFESFDYFENEKILKKILSNKELLNEVVVIVAPLKELISRAQKRIEVEPNAPHKYNNNYWLERIKKLNFFSIYEQLFEILDKKKIKYKVVFSSNKEFKISDRVYVYHNLRGRYIDLPSLNDVENLLQKKELNYQSVKLPYNLNSTPKYYKHIPKNRDLSFDPLKKLDLRNSSILDIGSAMGNFLFKAERYGATNLLGIEINKSRCDMSVEISRLLKSNVKFKNHNFDTENLNEIYDYVLCLNVIHHIKNFENFLVKAAKITGKGLVLEFPSLKDPKFTQYSNLKRFLINLIAKKELKISPKAIVQLFKNEGINFKEVRIMKSPIKGRIIMIFFK